MKFKRFVIIFTCLVFSCQNEVNVIQDDWVKDIDNVIKIYDKQAKIKSSKVLKEDDEECLIQFYHENAQNLQKIIATFKIEDAIDITKEIYLINDVVVLEKFRGMSPLLYKKRMKSTDPCCELIDKLTYYKSPTEGKIYMKELKIMSTEEKDIYINDLEMMDYKEKESSYIDRDFSRAQEWIDEIKEN
jgi:hypothetical protein